MFDNFLIEKIVSHLWADYKTLVGVGISSEFTSHAVSLMTQVMLLYRLYWNLHCLYSVLLLFIQYFPIIMVLTFIIMVY